jgi:mono/diheme cytochrome c family protein
MDPRNSQGQDRVDYRESPGDLTEVHAAIQREHRDPSADSTPIPLWLAAVCGAALVWAGGYFMTFHGGLRSDVFNERLSSPSILFGEATKQAKGAGEGGAAAAPVSLAAAGKAVYGANCAACHQPSGLGLAGQFPTLANTEYVKAEKRIVAIILKGVHGPLNVNGTVYNNAMPPQPLSDVKVAQVASYVRASFGNDFPEIDQAKVAAIRAEFADRTAPWTEAELLALPADVSTGPSVAAAPAAGATPTADAPAAPGPDLMALGKSQYMMICVACHQPNGMGLPAVFPPLGKSEWVSGDPSLLVAVILKGLQGPITVDGKPFNNMMPGQGPMLNDEKVAAIATYVRKSFGNNESEVSPAQVAELRKKFADRMAPWTEAEIKAAVGSAAAAPAAAPAP